MKGLKTDPIELSRDTERKTKTTKTSPCREPRGTRGWKRLGMGVESGVGVRRKVLKTWSLWLFFVHFNRKDNGRDTSSRNWVGEEWVELPVPERKEGKTSGTQTPNGPSNTDFRRLVVSLLNFRSVGRPGSRIKSVVTWCQDIPVSDPRRHPNVRGGGRRKKVGLQGGKLPICVFVWDPHPDSLPRR